MFLQRLFSFLSKDIAMDLGTANTLLFTKKHGIVINEPSVVAIDVEKDALLAVGARAKEFLGRTPKRIKAVRPMKDGVIADFDVTRAMVRFFVRKAIEGTRLVKPSMAICVPMGITQVEKKAVIDAAMLAGAATVSLIEEPMAAAVGSDLPVNDAVGNLVLDIGGGTTEVAVISMGGIATSHSIRVAGDAMNLAVQRYLRDVFCLEVGENTAENIKKLIGSAIPRKDAPVLEVSGKDLVEGRPKVITVSEGPIREALAVQVRAIVQTVIHALEKTPPELAADIYMHGLLMAGGGSLLYGLRDLLAQEIRVPVVLDKEPLTTVLRGTAKAMLNKKAYSSVFIN